MASIAVLPSTAAAAARGDLGAPLAESTFAGAVTSGPDGNVWFSADDYGSEGERVVGKVSPAGKVTEYPAPGGAPSLATGADGNVWFTEADGIGRITPGGEIASFALAPGSGTPQALTAGPDGNVWFVTDGPAAVGRITPGGSVTTTPLTGGGEPSAIVTGPAGDLWFTEPKTGRIGRITVAGEVTEFSLPDPAARPNSITLGSDGNLWFSDVSQPRVGRISPAGEVTFFPVPTIGNSDEVVAGPGGVIWFTAEDEIGRISTAGKVTWPTCFSRYCEYPPAAMAIGPEGQLWVASDKGHCPSYCGGGSELSYIFGSSSVGRFSLPPVSFGIGPGLAPVRHGQTRLVVGCGERAACAGTLRLRALVRPPSGFAARLISKLTYSLAAGEIREISVPLPRPRWSRLRFRRGFLIVDAVQGDSQVAKRGFYFSPEEGGQVKHF